MLLTRESILFLLPTFSLVFKNIFYTPKKWSWLQFWCVNGHHISPSCKNTVNCRESIFFQEDKKKLILHLDIPEKEITIRASRSGTCCKVCSITWNSAPSTTMQRFPCSLPRHRTAGRTEPAPGLSRLLSGFDGDVAVSHPCSVPAFPEDGVLATMLKTDEANSGVVVGECVSNLGWG